MKAKVALFSVVLGAALVLGACGEASSSGSDNKTKENKVTMSDKKEMLMKENEKVNLMGTLTGTGSHKVSGNVEIKDNKLMLTDFTTDEGPDLHVYLVKGNNIEDGVEISKVDLKAKNQSFDVSDKDLSKYDHVLIYCEKAHEEFGAAALMDTMDESATTDSMLTGMFSGAGSHKVSGDVTMTDNKLMFTNFVTDEGPDLHVYLTKDGDIESGKELAKIDLKAKEQTFSLDNINSADYNTVVIYCQKAHETFGQAMLNS
ncbi:DM13 domain-containing protein [Listeria sp. FSL L7-1485]|uniref:DM13 domain-containing protein n=1 Tax=Listeria immobilis TaxID=2713502 RepID=A0A7X1C9K7_9LIST|nr:DM13 domain-containing protein [Listeria immobilis]MBC1489422.1 DM13 domain-containing protein [Listeria immobilis]MBC1535123.1 DM13 domain-containing protein [Listeria immobilis]